MNDLPFYSEDPLLADPFLIYQNAYICFDFETETILASTTLWLAYAREVVPGSYLHLHCRQCKISEVLVNGISSDFVMNDPLKKLFPTTNLADGYESSKLDRQYKAALEVSRQGELRITIPATSWSSDDSSEYVDSKRSFKPIYRSVNKPPAGTSRDVVSRCDALNSLLQRLRASRNVDGPLDGSGTKYGKILQVKVSYILERKKGNGSWPAGFAFSRQSEYDDGFDGSHGAKTGSNVPEASCVYSTNGAHNNESLDSFDGVRCWLPCVDKLDQRAIFDITIHAPMSKNAVMCTGEPLSKSDRYVKRSELRSFFVRHEDANDQMDDNMSDAGDATINPMASDLINDDDTLAFSSTRFFSLQRIAATNVGFFVGIGESYHMPLYRCRGRIVIALNINDYTCNKPPPTRAEHKLQNKVSSKDIDSPRIVTTGSNKDSNAGNKRARFHEVADVATSARKRSVSFVDPPEKEMDSPTSNYRKRPRNSEKVESSSAASSSRHIYADKVRHSLLGFDMAQRIIHKFLGRRYHHDSYGQIYVPNLGCDFIAFDGFSLIDAKYLHDNHELFAETPHHLMQMRSYLYSYITATMQVAGYLNEYLIHGTVAYILHLYIQYVYGEDESMYYLWKASETVLGLEKLTADDGTNTSLPPLASISCPENYDRFSPYFGSYLINKSLVLFHILENRLGGSEPLQKVLNQILRAPENIIATQSDHETPSSPKSPSPATHDENEKISNDETKNHPPHSSVIYAPNTPSHYDAYMQQHNQLNHQLSMGSSSPSWMGSFSPSHDLFTSMASPMLYTQSPGLSDAYYSMSPQYSPDMYSPQHYHNLSPALIRQSSLEEQTNDPSKVGHIKSNYMFPASLTADFLTGDMFLGLCRSAVGSTYVGDLNGSIIDDMIYTNYTIRGKIDLVLDPKQDNKARNLHIGFDSISATAMDTNMKFRIWEEREDRITEPEIVLKARNSSRKQSERQLLLHSQSLYSKPGRRVGSHSKTGPSTTDPSTNSSSNPSKASDATSSTAIQTKIKSSTLNIVQQLQNYFAMNPMLFELKILNTTGNTIDSKTSLQLSRYRLFPLKMFLFDPDLLLPMNEVNISALPDSILIEQLFSEIDSKDIIRQIRAMQALATAQSSIINLPKATNTGGSDIALRAEKITSLQFHALADCLFGINPTPLVTMDANITGRPYQQSIFLRLEAAFSLAKWQQDRLQEVSNSSSLLVAGNSYWEAAWLLIKFIVDNVVAMSSQDLTEELSTTLRNGVLMATAQIKTKNGITPMEIMDLFVYICETLYGNRSSPHQYAQDHAIAILLLAMSHFQIELDAAKQLNAETILTDKESKNPIHRIIQFARNQLLSSIKTATDEARLRHSSRKDDQSCMPSLPCGGLLCTAAITCLGHFDRLADAAFHGFSDRTQLTPSTIGRASGINYAHFFLPFGATLHLSRHGNTNDSIVSSFHSPVNTPSMRCVALEAYIYSSVALYSALVASMRLQQMQQRSASSSSTPAAAAPPLRIPDNSIVPAIIETVLAIIKYDPDKYVRRRAALTLLRCLQDAPPNAAFESMTLGHVGYAYGFGDPKGLIFMDSFKVYQRAQGVSTSASNNTCTCLRTSISVIRKEVRSWWRTIVMYTSDQSVRTLLIQTWIFVFRDKVPRALQSTQNPSTEHNPLSLNDNNKAAPKLSGMMDTLCPTLPTIFDPTENFTRIEMRLKHGSTFILRNSKPPLAPQSKTAPPPVLRIKESNKASIPNARGVSLTKNILIPRDELGSRPPTPSSVSSGAGLSIAPPMAASSMKKTDIEPSTSLKLTLKRNTSATKMTESTSNHDPI